MQFQEPEIENKFHVWQYNELFLWLRFCPFCLFKKKKKNQKPISFFVEQNS